MRTHEHATRTDDSAILELVKAYGRVGGYSFRILGKGITTEFGARGPTSIQAMVRLE